MFDLIEKQNATRKRGTAANSAAPVTALYERLSCEDETEHESNSITNYVETGFYTEVYFARMGVRFIAINNGIDNANPDSTEFSGILNIMNDWYLHDLSRKVRSSAQLRGKAGKTLAANPCFGYVKDPGDKNRWLIDPEAAQTIRRIYELAAAGGSQVSICRTLAKEQHMTPGCYRAQWEPNGFCGQHAGKNPYLWNPRMIREIVKRREYLGETVNFKTCCPDLHARQIDNPPDKWLCFPGTHEAIVTPEVWHAAQRIYHPDMSNKPGKPCKLTGMIICGECGAPMLFSRNNRHERYNNYACRTNQQSVGYAERLCSRNGIQVAVIRQIVGDTLRTVNRYAITDEEGFRHRLAKTAATYQPDDRKQLAKHIREKEKHIARLEHLLKKLYEDYALGHIPEERFDRLSAQYEQEEATLKAELADDQARLSEVQTASAQTDKYLALARKYRDCSEVTDDMILAFVEKIVVYRTIRPAKGQRTRQIEVHLNYIGQFPIPTEGMENENE